ncbi:MAG TPA: asparagine--tRNA ligase [Candidatus Hydrothermia bacterium]|nr:asparagine--tRNA ligase [Candidatus Hydrothermae bacterium]HOP33050.1 asparagine--tRNA ligase [Candidatus Hydrothermia bacterium]HRD22459.1 asparagine--tRNA ligase [Candidatus Hydrothermia bacterium]
MGKFVYISELKEKIGEEVEIRGWVYNKRSSGKIRFIIVRDGSGYLQCVMAKGQIEDQYFDLFDDLTLETSVIVQGKVREDVRAPEGVEVDLNFVKIIGPSENFPIPKVREDNIPDPGVLLPIRHLWLRTRRQWAIMRIRHTIEKAIHDYYDNLGFIRIDSPILTPAACEGTTTLFETDYFGEKAYLSQSGQLYQEATCMAHGKTYCFGPTFRAEKSKTRRHLMEFWMVEPEIAYAELPEVMENAEGLIVYIVEQVLNTRQEELKILDRNITKLEKIKKPFPRISYTEVIELLKKKGFNIEWGEDFGGDEETAISEDYETPVIVHRYPAKIKAFYMKRDPENPDLALAMDILAPEGYGEIVGGSQREDDIETLIQRIKEFDLPQEAFEWYLDLRRYGSVPHGGYGLGLERTIAWICGLKHVRETIPFPRMLERIYP